MSLKPILVAAIILFIILAPCSRAIADVHDSPRSRTEPTIFSAPTTQCANGWYEGSPVNGVAGRVAAIASDGEGNIYVGGYFRAAGNKIVNNVAKWDGSSWSALGTGTNGEVKGIAFVGGSIYIAGIFTTAGGVPANYVAKWNGSTWSPVGSGPPAPVYDLEVSGNDIYVSGGMTDPSDNTTSGYVAKWTGNSWANLGAELDFHVWSIAVSGTNVYAGGPFSGGPIVRWTGFNWTSISAGFNGYFGDMAISGSDLYAVGYQSLGPSSNLGFLARWNGTNWVRMGSGMTYPNGYVFLNSVAISGTEIYVGGQFETAGGVPANGKAKWDGSTWSAVGTWSGSGDTIAVIGNDVYFGGSFYSSSGSEFRLRANGIAKWDGSTWTALGGGEYAFPDRLASSGTELYGAGYFSRDGGNTSYPIGKWSSSGWTPLGAFPSGAEGTVPSINALVASGTDLYAGGAWVSQSSSTLGRGFVFKWNGADWIELGSGFAHSQYSAGVFSIAVSGTVVYAGGFFTTSGGTAVNNIARWNGSNWTPLREGTNSGVLALSISGADLYAGGEFTSAGGTSADKIAKWDGTGWSALGDGPMRPAAVESGFRGVTSILVSGIDIYAGGGWDLSDYEDVGFVSKWNGSGWTEMIQSCCGNVSAMARLGNSIYAAGMIQGGVIRIDGTGGSSIGFNGEDYTVTGLAATNSELFVSGAFSTAGCGVSANFARYSPVASISGRVTTPSGQPLRNAIVTLTDANGKRRMATTSSLGFYTISNVPPGQSYTATVSSRRYRFTPRTIIANGNLTNIDFVGLE
jgi:hypothetical protein